MVKENPVCPETGSQNDHARDIRLTLDGARHAARDATAVLAREITWKGSKQTTIIGRLMVDGDLVDDFYRAYAYFRWADDVIDVSSRSDEERSSFIRRQRELIDSLYQNKLPSDLMPEEEILADLISRDREENSGLQSFIYNMLAIIEFDTVRKGQLISQRDLIWYSERLAKSVTDGLQYFIGNAHSYPITDNRYLAANGAHIAHLLRDMLPDTADGLINIPRDFLEANGIGPEDVNSLPYRAWVQSRVEQARRHFHEGRRYFDELDVLRCKIVGYWYCARFENVLDAIEHEHYRLRASYDEGHNFLAGIRMVWIAFRVTLRHIVRRGFRAYSTR